MTLQAFADMWNVSIHILELSAELPNGYTTHVNPHTGAQAECYHLAFNCRQLHYMSLHPLSATEKTEKEEKARQKEKACAETEEKEDREAFEKSCQL